jgi:hypothetical protein
MAQTAYYARFTPSSIESRRTGRGHAQLRSRGVIENRNGGIVRSVIAYGRLHDEILPKLEEGRPVLLKGYYERVQNPDGSTGGEFFKPFAVIRVYERPVPPPANDPTPAAVPTGRVVEGHEREGHWRWQWCGKGRTERRRVRVRSCKVNGGRRD